MRRHQRTAIALWGVSLIGLPLLPSGAQQREPAPGEEDFGRWEQSASRCRIVMPDLAAPSPAREGTCRGLRLDQQMAGLLGVRFLASTSRDGAPPGQLVFAGVLRRTSQPMACRDGRCTPRWPMVLQVSAVASNAFSALGLPTAQVALGECRLELHRATCQARDREGRQWQAQMQW